MNNESWVDKHRPETYSEIQGNNKAIEGLREWVTNWTQGDPPKLLYGEPGVGKTSTAHVMAKQEDLDLNELNTSNARKSGDVRRIAQEARSGEQLVLLDEADSWHHSVDLKPLSKELAEPSNPILLTVNSVYDTPYSLKRHCDEVEFKLGKASRRAKIKEIAKAESVPLDDEDLKRLVERPDLRSAINDLQLNAEMGVPVSEDQREWETSEFAVMDRMIQQGKPDTGDVKPDWLLLWLDQNIRKEYRGLEAAMAYKLLSKADIHIGDAGPGNWKGWRWGGELLAQTANVRLSDAYGGWVSWDFPEWVKSSAPSRDDEEPEAALYRDLKRERGCGYVGSYFEFRKTALKVLKALPGERKASMVMNEGISQEGAEALGIGAKQYEGMHVREDVTEGEALPEPTGDAMESDW